MLLAPPQAARLGGTNGTAHQELRPEDREINYYLAWVKWMRDDNDEAAELVFPLLAEAGDDEQQERFRQLYLAGRAVEAYDRTEDAGRSFALLAEWLDDDERAKELGELMERHRTTDPNDSGLLYFEGRIAELVQLGRLEEALQEALIHDAESYTPPLTLATVHAARHDIPQTLQALAKCLRRGCSVEEFYEDKLLGKLLTSDALAEVRERYPPESRRAP